MSYICNTANDIEAMLRSIGVRDINDLFADIPGTMLLKKLIDLPQALSEVEVCELMKSIGGGNRVNTSFMGAGSYRHYIPAVVDALSSRSEFYTAYTPYQAEVSQGTLVAVFEFQTLICRLTGMDVANASMYDGATSLAEAVLMSVRTGGRKKIAVSGLIHPSYRDVLKTYCWANDLHMVEVAHHEGVTDHSAVENILDESISALVVQNPNFLGRLESLNTLADKAHRVGAHLIVAVTEPLSLGILKSPGSVGADIVCGEARSFGNPVGFGGPALGLLAAKEEFLRRMPGRLIGKTVDHDGNEAFTLTLQTREQHIRRERATSNICTNQGLCALRAVIYLSLLGNSIRELALLNHRITAYCRYRMMEIGYEPLFQGPYFNEFPVKMQNAAAILEKLSSEGIDGGVHLGKFFKEYEDSLLICCTEMVSPSMVDHFVDMLKKL